MSCIFTRRTAAALAVGLLLCSGVLVSELFADASSVRKLQGRLQKAVAAGDGGRAREVVGLLADTGELTAAKTIVQAVVKTRKLGIYDGALRALVRMKEDKVRSWLAKQSRRSKSWQERYFLLDAISRIDDPGCREAIGDAAAKEKNPRVQDFAIDLLSKARQPWAVETLIGLLESFSRKKQLAPLAQKVSEILSASTGHSIETAADWRKWWEGAKSGFRFPGDRKPSDSTGRTGVKSVIERLKDRDEAHFFGEMVAGDVIVVTGKFDHVENVLKKLAIPHQIVERTKLKDFVLKPTSVVVFNCHSEDVLSAEALEKVGKFVSAGGYLFSSDWELQNVLLKSFPRTIGQGPKTGNEGMEVGIEPSEKNQAHPYLRDVFPRNPFKLEDFKWKIDSVSAIVRVPPGGKVLSLVESTELAKQYGGGAVAATFRYGRGSVLHVLSHFIAQRDASGDGFALQQMLANFIVEKQKWRRKAKAKVKR